MRRTRHRARQDTCQRHLTKVSASPSSCVAVALWRILGGYSVAAAAAVSKWNRKKVLCCSRRAALCIAVLQAVRAARLAPPRGGRFVRCEGGRPVRLGQVWQDHLPFLSRPAGPPGWLLETCRASRAAGPPAQRSHAASLRTCVGALQCLTCVMQLLHSPAS